MRRILLVLALATAALPAGIGLPAAADPAPIATLRVGDSVFWDGPFVEKAGTGTREADALLCRGTAGNMFGCAGPQLMGKADFVADKLTPHASLVGASECQAPACYRYFLDLVQTGERLRIALDRPDIRDVFEVFVYDPTGTIAARAGGWYTIETTIDNPAVGRWTVRVRLRDVEESAFRMRAVLQGPPQLLVVPQTLLPNLKATPPFDLVFGGCQATEIVQYGAVRCLRLSTGPANVGDGPLDLRIQDVGATGVNWQWIHRTDGTFLVRPAGTFVWHTEHLHYHHVGTGDYRLYRVVDHQTGELVQAGQGPKVGFCMGDYLIAEWRSFDQEPQGSGSGTCLGIDGPLGTQMGLTKGWGDIYRYETEANYVDFGTNPDGLYVVRVATDASNTIAELIEDDNHGYAYIRVTGDHIDVLERGYGLSPWDPAKVVADDIRNPTV